MSRGIGTTQQAILDALTAETEYLALTVTELAARLGLPTNQTRRAARALEARGQVVITKDSYRKGIGEYGRLTQRHSWSNNYGPEVPTATVLKAGDPWPWGSGRYTASRDVELVHGGMPTPCLLVWLPENRIKWLEQPVVFGPRAEWKEHREEYQRLTNALDS